MVVGLGREVDIGGVYSFYPTYTLVVLWCLVLKGKFLELVIGDDVMNDGLGALVVVFFIRLNLAG